MCLSGVPAPYAGGQVPEGEIAFVSDRGGDSDIYLMPAAGGAVRDLTDDPAEDAAPTWSPDGTRLAFASTRHGTWDLFVMSLPDGAVRRLTDGPGAEFDPSWSPGADRILYESTVRGRRSLRAVRLSGASTESLARPSRRHFDLDPQWWSGTGPDIVFSSDRTGSFNLWVTTIGGAARPLTKGSGGDFHPTLSPDGTRVAFERARRDDYDLYVLAQKQGRLRRLTAGGADDSEPTWGPDGRHVAFVSDRDGLSDLYVVDTATRRVTNVTRTSQVEETTPAWRPRPRASASTASRPVQTPASASCPALGPLSPTDRGTQFFGYATDETICGGPGDDRIWGRGGDDQLAGDAGRDALWGGSGDDQLFGGPHIAGVGADRLFGQGGDDRLWANGDRARDCVNGGPGNDRARLSLGRDSWADNRRPAPWGEKRCGDLRTIEALE